MSVVSDARPEARDQSVVESPAKVELRLIVLVE
jgi:hypothetical protein